MLEEANPFEKETKKEAINLVKFERVSLLILAVTSKQTKTIK